MNTKVKGDVAELAVATDLRRQGHKVAFPYGENWDADLLVEAAGRLERVQVKHTTSDGVTDPRALRSSRSGTAQGRAPRR